MMDKNTTGVFFDYRLIYKLSFVNILYVLDWTESFCIFCGISTRDFRNTLRAENKRLSACEFIIQERYILNCKYSFDVAPYRSDLLNLETGISVLKIKNYLKCYDDIEVKDQRLYEI